MSKEYIEKEFIKILEEYGKEYLIYTAHFERRIAKLERSLHRVEDPEHIAREALVVAVEFYDGDWCGIIEGDLDIEAWHPVLWYDRKAQGMTGTLFHELEETLYMGRWLEALRVCQPIIIEDTEKYKVSNPKEYEVYRRCGARSILAVPFGNNLNGFMIIRNPKRFYEKSSFLQAIAYVVFSSVKEKRLLQIREHVHTKIKIEKDTDVIIKLFGNMEIYTSKGFLTEEEINSPKYCCILAYFLLNEKRPRPAQAVWKELWPNENSENAGNNMRSLFVRFRDVFGIICDYRLIVSSPRGYQLNPKLNIITDLDMFDECCLKADKEPTIQGRIEILKKAISIYRGDVFKTAGSEHWILAHEVRYKYKCLEIYNELMKAYFSSGNYVSVEYYAQQALEIEQANEDAYYWMIRSLRKRGSNIMAKGQLHMARHVLDAEEYDRLNRRIREQGESYTKCDEYLFESL